MIKFEQDPSMYGGRPMLPGTGLPAWIVAQMIQSGEDIPDILEAYPFLTKELLEVFFIKLKNASLHTLGAPDDIQ